MAEKFEVTGYDREGRKVFRVLVEAPTGHVAKLYETGHLQRSPDGAAAVLSAVKIRGNPQAHSSLVSAISPVISKALSL